jgi:glycosyltransferase involved in cell wall biosynthesis
LSSAAVALAPPAAPAAAERLRIAYAIQNVGGIDFTQDLGDTVPVKQTLRGLQRLGHEVTCFVLKNRSVLALDDVAQPVNVRAVPLGVSATRPFLVFESAVRRVQRELHVPYFALFDLYRFHEAAMRTLPGYALCHEHNGLFSAGAALACQQLRIPYVLTFSADLFLERTITGKPLTGLHRQVAAWESQFTYRVARKILCVSEPAKRHLIDTWRVNPDKVVVMPNGVDTELFKPYPQAETAAIRAQLGLGTGPVIGFLGAFQPWHGIEVLVASFARVLDHTPDARLLLIGDGRARPQVEAAIEKWGVGGATVITGVVPQVRVPAYLGAVDVAVIPYPRLPQELWFSPLKLYEYMAAGKAIVASRAGQIASVMRHHHTGLLVEPGNADVLARAIQRLVDDPDARDRLGRAARQQALAQHSWHHYVSRLEAVYRDALRMPSWN